MLIPIEITAVLETSDHDGYCSGEECEYNTQQIQHRCKIPTELFTWTLTDKYMNWTQLMPVPYKQSRGGSNWCGLSNQCERAQLMSHQYRYRLVSVRVLPFVSYDQIGYPELYDINHMTDYVDDRVNGTTGNLLELDECVLWATYTSQKKKKENNSLMNLQTPIIQTPITNTYNKLPNTIHSI